MTITCESPNGTRFVSDRTVAAVRVLVVDDHQMFAQALAAVLTADAGIATAVTESSVEAAVSRLRREPSDVVLLDLRLPDADRMTGIERIRAAAPGAAVVLVTAVDDESVLLEAVERGCVGFILKTADLTGVVTAVHRAAAGDSLVSPRVLKDLLARVADRGPGLTPREAQVLAGIVRGSTNADIGRELFLSVNTVRNHVQSLLSKLGAHSKLEAAAIAVRDNLLGG